MRNASRAVFVFRERDTEAHHDTRVYCDASGCGSLLGGSRAKRAGPIPGAPSSGPASGGQQKAVIPPAVRGGEKGLTVGDGAADKPIEVKRQK
jgi:hypothetical protein